MNQALFWFVSINWLRRDVRCGRVTSYAADFGYVFEGARVGGLYDELFAKGFKTSFGDGCHAGVFEGNEELLVLVRGHF